MGEEMKEPIMAEVFLESQIGTDAEDVLYTGPLVKAYRYWKKYNWEHPFDQWARLRYEQPDGSMFVSKKGERESMRLIDADALHYWNPGHLTTGFYGLSIADIQNAPTVPSITLKDHIERMGRATIKYVEVEKLLEKCLKNEAKIVRCRDCVWHPKCRYEQVLGLDGFCSRGEWRTKNADTIPMDETRRTVEASEEGCTGTQIPPEV